jgi:hypothetical protein
MTKPDFDDAMTLEAISVIRTLLRASEVPTAAFVDDHVANAIVQRNKLRNGLLMIAHKFPETKDMVASTLNDAAMSQHIPTD